LRGTRYIWLRNPANLSERQKATLDSLPTHHLKTVQAAKAKARGYRSTRNLKAMVYLLAGKLDLRLPA
jgi:transposase